MEEAAGGKVEELLEVKEGTVKVVCVVGVCRLRKRGTRLIFIFKVYPIILHAFP